MRMAVEREIVMCKVKPKSKELSHQGGPVTETVKPGVRILMHLLNQKAMPYD